MNKQDDNKLWQLLGEASSPAPSADFSRKVMMRIMNEKQECAPVINAIPFFKRPAFRIWTGAAAAVVAGVIGISSMLGGTDTVSATELAAIDIDDVLVQEAAMALGQESLMDAMCTMAASETGVIPADGIQEFLL